MGCHHSKVNEQVKDTSAPAAESNDVVTANAESQTETVQEVATAPTEEAVEPATTEEEAKNEVKAEEPAVVADEVKVEEPSAEAVTEVKAEETVAEVEVVEETKEEATEPAVEVVTETVAEVAEEAVVAEPETEEKPHEEAAEVKGATSFDRAGVTFGERHVAFYAFKLTDKEDPAKEATISKRYNDFKALHAALTKLMASESNVPAESSDKFKTYPALPALPKAGLGSFVKGRRNKGLTDEREVQFEKILNAIARHPIASQSTEFQTFLA